MATSGWSPRGVRASILLAAASASAEEQLSKNAPRDMWLSKEQIKAKVESMGYTKVRIGTEHGCYEAHATARDGKRHEIYLEPTTGNVVRTKGR